MNVMRVEEFVSVGHAEPVKGAAHGLAAVVCGLMFAYNTTAWLFRREPHLAINALVYGSAILYEGVQTRQHIAARASAARNAARLQDRALVLKQARSRHASRSKRDDAGPSLTRRRAGVPVGSGCSR